MANRTRRSEQSCTKYAQSSRRLWVPVVYCGEYVVVRRRRSYMSPRWSVSHLQSIVIIDYIAVRADVLPLYCGNPVAAGVLFLYAVRDSHSGETAGPQSQRGKYNVLVYFFADSTCGYRVGKHHCSVDNI